MLHYFKVNINRKSATQLHLQLHDQVVVCPTLVEVLQSHHVVVLYPETVETGGYLVLFNL